MSHPGEKQQIARCVCGHLERQHFDGLGECEVCECSHFASRPRTYVPKSKLEAVERELAEEKQRVALWRKSTEEAREDLEAVEAERDEFRGKLQAGYSFCHPEDDCEGQRAWLKAATDRDNLQATLNALLGDEAVRAVWQRWNPSLDWDECDDETKRSFRGDLQAALSKAEEQVGGARGCGGDDSPQWQEQRDAQAQALEEDRIARTQGE